MEVFPLPNKNDSSVRLERLSNLLDEHLTTSGHATRVDRCVYGAVSQALGRLQPPDGWLLLGLLSTNFYGVVGSRAACLFFDAMPERWTSTPDERAHTELSGQRNPP